MAISSSLRSGADFIRSETLLQNQERLADFNRQLATGERATSYGDLGSSRVQSISLRSDVSRLEAFQDSIQRVNIRVDLTVLPLERLESIRSEARDAVNTNNFVDLGNGNTFAQQLTEVLLTETVALLNSQADGRYVFGGNDVGSPPVESLDLILSGDAARAGLRDVTDERLSADLGANGLGRLGTVIDPATPSVVTLSEGAVTDFGFDIAGVDNDLSGVNATFSGGEPARLDVDFTAQPAIGENIRLFVDLPDGTQEIVTLTAGAQSGGLGAFALGSTSAETAANFQDALRNEIGTLARTELSAVSRLISADNFFNTESGRLPQRVDLSSGGGTPETATGLVDGTENNTVLFYTGQNDAEDPRLGLTARVDDTISVDYGLRANEEGLRSNLATLAAFSVADFTDSTLEDNQAAYAALASRATNDLATQVGEPSIQSIVQEIAGIQAIAGNANERHTIAINALDGIREDIERADPTEVALQLLGLQTTIEASFAASGRINELSLLEFV